jgi:hypothetical protein
MPPFTIPPSPPKRSPPLPPAPKRLAPAPLPLPPAPVIAERMGATGFSDTAARSTSGAFGLPAGSPGMPPPPYEQPVETEIGWFPAGGRLSASEGSIGIIEPDSDVEPPEGAFNAPGPVIEPDSDVEPPEDAMSAKNGPPPSGSKAGKLSVLDFGDETPLPELEGEHGDFRGRIDWPYFLKVGGFGG